MILEDLSGELVAAYAELRRYLDRRLGSADAADVAQASFEKVLAYAHSAPVASPRALLFTTARNLLVDEARHRAAARGWFEAQAALAEEAAVPSAEESAAQRQHVERVDECLRALPARRREVFLLSRVFGCSRAEVAARMGITEAAVAKHLVRATVDCARAVRHLPRP